MSAFADTWSEKKSVHAEVGLKLIAAVDVEQARQDAARQAIKWYEGREGECIDEIARDEAYNDALMRFVIARSACDPKNPKQPFFEVAEETIRIALTNEGVRLLWDELVILHRGTGVNQPPIEAEEVEELAAILVRSGSIDRLPSGTRGEIRRLLAYCLEELREVNPHDDEDDGEPVYVARSA